MTSRDILDLEIKQVPDADADPRPTVKIAVLCGRALGGQAPQFLSLQQLCGQDLCQQRIVGIMSIVGDVIRNVCDLGFEALTGADWAAIQLRPVVGCPVFHQSCSHFPRQVQPREIRILDVQQVDPSEALLVVVKSAKPSHQRVQFVFPCVPERAVANVVREGNGLRERLIHVKDSGQRSCNCGDFNAVRQSSSVVIAIATGEDLGLVFEAPKASAVNNAVPVPLKTATGGVLLFAMMPSPRLGIECCVGRQHCFFLSFKCVACHNEAILLPKRGRCSTLFREESNLKGG